MKIKWLGHSCFLITAGSGLKIMTDPYDVDGLLRYGRVREQADIVTISHHHADHSYTGDMPGTPEIVEGTGISTVRGISFEGIASYHDESRGSRRGDNTIFCFTVDGIRLCHCGDLGHMLDDAALKALGKVDVLFIPTGGSPPTIDLDEAISLWEKLEPAVVIPMHYKNEKCSFPKHTIEDLVRKRPAAIKPGKTEVEYSKDTLPSKQVILLLDHAL